MSVSNLLKALKHDKYSKHFLGLGMLGLLSGIGYFTMNGFWISALGGMLGIIYTLFGVFRITAYLLMTSSNEFMKARLSVALLIIYGIFVYILSSKINFIFPYSFVNWILQTMAFLCAALNLSALTTPSNNAKRVNSR